MSRKALIDLIESLPENALPGAMAELKKLIPTDIIIDLDMGSDHKFAKQGFRREKPRRFIGKTKFRVSRVVELGQPAIIGDKMLQVANDRGCDITLEEGEPAAAFFNSPAGRAAYKAIKDAGILYIVLPGKGSGEDIWVDGSTSNRCVPVLICYGKRCVSVLDYLGSGFGSDGGLLVPCNES